MKFCKKAFDSLYIGMDGKCSFCSWMNVFIGDLSKESIEEVFYGEKAEKIREEFKNGDYSHCNHISCPYLENDTLPDLTKEQIDKLTSNVAIKSMALGYDRICNHACPCCRNEIFVPDDEEVKKYEKINAEILPIMNEGCNYIELSGAGDMFASKYSMELAQNLKPKNKYCHIGIQTNGALFNENNWKKIEHFKDYFTEVIVTPNSYNRINHQYLSGGRNSYDSVINNLYFIKSLREKNYIKSFCISVVVQERNFYEVLDFVERSINDFGCDKVIIKPLYKWFFITEENYWYKDILNPLHPYHKQYMDILNSPILDNPKVFLWGAKNIHKPSLHPAYKYKDYLNVVSQMLTIDNYNNKLKDFIEENNAKDVIVYGDNELSHTLCTVLKNNGIEVRYILARDFNCCDCEAEIEKKSLKDYIPNENDFVLISNYQVRNLIERDLYFNNFNGKLYDIAEVNEIIKNR